MPVEELEFELKADTTTAEKKLKRFEDDAEGFRRRIQDKKAIKLSLNVAEIKSQLDNVKQQLKEVDDEEIKIELEAETERLKQQLTRAKAELRNYARTWNKDVSVLGKLFQWVASDIDKTRLELIKLGKSTDRLNDIEKELNQINEEFKAGKISVQQYGSKLNQLQGNIKNTDGAFWGLKKTLKSTAGFLVAGIWLAEAWQFAKDSVQSFREFEKGLARINTVANVTDKQMEALGSQIKDISVQFGIAKDELLETGFNISSAWVEFQNVATILKLSAITAIGASTDTTTAFNWIIAVLKKYGEDLNQAGAIAEKFFIANKLGQTTIEDMAQALQNLTSSAKPAGVSINEVFAILSTLTGVTGDANAVITQLNGAINAIAAPTTEASNKFKELGIEVGQSAIEQKGFVTVAKEIYDAVGGNQEQLRKLIPEIEASKLVIALATTQNDKYNQSLKEVTEGNWNLEEAVRKMANTTDFQLNVTTKKWDNFKTATGKALVEAGAFLYDFWQLIISTFKIFGWVLKNGVVSIIGFSSTAITGVIEITKNWKEFARIIPEFTKEAFDNLPQIAEVALRKLLAKFWPLGDTLANKLGLEESLGGVFENIDTNFNFTNTKKLFDTTLKEIQKNNDNIDNEWGKITDIVTFNSKEQQLAISETIDEVKNLQQSFGSLWDTNDETTKSQEDLTKSIENTTDSLKEQEEEEKKAKKLLEEKQKLVENLGKENQKVYEGILDDIEKWVDGLEEYIEKIAEVNDKIAELKDDAVSNIRDINNELGNLDVTRQEDLGERNLEILEEQKKIQKEIKALEREWVSLSTAQGIGKDTLSKIDERATIWSSGVEDLLEILELNEKLNALNKERQTILENTTEDERKRAEELSKLSEADRIIKDAQVQKDVLEERKRIYEAIKNGEKIKFDEIEDYKNLRLAEELDAKQLALNTELDTLKNNLEEQKQALLEINQAKKQFEADWTAFFGTEIQKQKDYAKELQAELRRVIALQKEAGLQGVKLWTTATAEQEKAINGSVDNSKKVNVNINANNNIDVDLAVQKISETIK